MSDREPLFSTKNIKLLTEPLGDEQPHNRSGTGYLFSPGYNG